MDGDKCKGYLLFGNYGALVVGFGMAVAIGSRWLLGTATAIG
ncbi:hypothetical protein [Vallitalea pronyensis]|nr:hypothetical protein [Vallitalea pronyensis]